MISLPKLFKGKLDVFVPSFGVALGAVCKPTYSNEQVQLYVSVFDGITPSFSYYRKLNFEGQNWQCKNSLQKKPSSS